MTPRWEILLALFLSIVLVGPEARAKGMIPSTLVQRGEAALAAGDLNTAEQAFTAAYRQSPSAELLFPLGRLAAAQEQLLVAQDLLRRYMNNPAVTVDTHQSTEAQKILARPRPPSGKVRVQGDRGGLVLVDGRLRGSLPLVQPLLAAPGTRTITIQYPGKLLDVRIEVVAGRMVDIQCTRATGAIFVATPPALLLLAELPELSSVQTEQLLDAVERAAQGRQLTILKPEALLTLIPELKNLPETKAQAELKTCLGQPDCLQRMLRQTKLDYALRIRASAMENKTDTKTENKATDKSETLPTKQWEFATELLHVSVLGAASLHNQHCAACGDQKAAASLQDTVGRTLAVGLTRTRGTLTVSSEPAGAQVWLGERLLGQTPLTLPSWPGEYTLELRHPGHTPLRKTLGVESGKTAAVAVSLPVIEAPPAPVVVPPPITVPAAPPPPVALHWQRDPRPRWRLIAGATSIAAGVTFSLLGALALQSSAASYCPLIYDPQFPPPGCDLMGVARERDWGIASTVLGGALIFSGVGILVWPGPRRLVP